MLSWEAYVNHPDTINSRDLYIALFYNTVKSDINKENVIC